MIAERTVHEAPDPRRQWRWAAPIVGPFLIATPFGRSAGGAGEALERRPRALGRRGARANPVMAAA
jgi:hypothetical protein